MLFRSAEQLLDAHWVPAVQAWALGSKPLQTPVAVLQPLPHWVFTSVPSSHREAVAPWHEEPAPSHWTHREPSAEQKLPAAHAWAQHTLPPLTVLTHALVAHSPFSAQASPTLAKQLPPTASRPAGHTQLPSAPHALPEPAHVASQQRSVPVTSIEQVPD
jgi:hypothetical protein